VKVAVTILIFCVAALLALGMVMLYSSSMTQVGAHYLVMQLIWCGAGLVGCVVAACIDYRLFKRFVFVLVPVAVVLLALVLVPQIGAKHGGARRWFDFGPVSFQPSELGKLAVLVFVAWYGERYQRQMGGFIRGIVIPGAVVAVLLGLIFLEPDVGCPMLLATVSCVMLLLAGIKWRYFLPPVAIALVCVLAFLHYDPMRSRRIYAWLHPEETKLGTGLQAYQSMVAIGSGGLTGRGLGEGRQKLGFVPEHHTDFIFSIIGEELGLAATLGVLAVFAVLVSCGLFIACHASDVFGLLLGSGISFMIGIQMFINIGVVTNLLPNKGMPLPFISYGGSNLLFMLCAIGLLLSIARHSREPQLRSAGVFEPDDKPPKQSK
jgi:cell division protein FtsW